MTVIGGRKVEVDVQWGTMWKKPVNDSCDLPYLAERFD